MQRKRKREGGQWRRRGLEKVRKTRRGDEIEGRVTINLDRTLRTSATEKSWFT